MSSQHLEVTDLLWSFDEDGRRRPVRRRDVLEQFHARGQAKAASLVAGMPTTGDVIDPAFVDRLGLRVHCELQRLAEEMQLGRRVAATLGPLTAALPGDGPVRIVDVGCGLGYVIRALAARQALGPGVQLVGVDLNPVLVTEAARLARLEGLDCSFVTGDALQPGGVVADGRRTILISTGLLHHIPAPRLADFFAAHEQLRVGAFAHWDLTPGLVARTGAWIFHQARMREPVSRHDGNLSVRRAHDPQSLRAAVRAGAPSYTLAPDAPTPWQVRALEVLRPVIGALP